MKHTIGDTPEEEPEERPEEEDTRSPMERIRDEYHDKLMERMRDIGFEAEKHNPGAWNPPKTLGEIINEAGQMGMLGGFASPTPTPHRGRYNPLTGQWENVPQPQDFPPAPKVPVPDPQDEPTVQLYGMQRLKDMSKEDMINEVCYHARLGYEQMDTASLRHLVVHARIATYSNRMHREAAEAGGGGLFGGMFGGFKIGDDD